MMDVGAMQNMARGIFKDAVREAKEFHPQQATTQPHRLLWHTRSFAHFEEIDKFLEDRRDIAQVQYAFDGQHRIVYAVME